MEANNWCKETEPVFYCTKCLSLHIKKNSYIRNGVKNEGSICCKCGSFNIKTIPFNKWVQLAEDKGIKVERPAKWAYKLNLNIK